MLTFIYTSNNSDVSKRFTLVLPNGSSYQNYTVKYKLVASLDKSHFFLCDWSLVKHEFYPQLYEVLGYPISELPTFPDKHVNLSDTLVSAVEFR